MTGTLLSAFAVAAFASAIVIGPASATRRGEDDAQRTAAAAPDCARPANRIVAENCKPGNPPTEWDVNGSGDLKIQGFATDISVNAGETMSFKIDSGRRAYRIDIYRLGYYGGMGARQVASIPPSDAPQSQPVCLTVAAVRLYDCGNWDVSASWAVPRDAMSGIHLARLVRQDSEPPSWAPDNSRTTAERPAPLPHAYGALGLGKLANALKEPRASHIYFIVRNDDSRADCSFRPRTRRGRPTTAPASPARMAASTRRADGRAFKVSEPAVRDSRLPRRQPRLQRQYPKVRWLRETATT
jgi:hypothetical protein